MAKLRSRGQMASRYMLAALIAAQRSYVAFERCRTHGSAMSRSMAAATATRLLPWQWAKAAECRCAAAAVPDCLAAVVQADYTLEIVN